MPTVIDIDGALLQWQAKHGKKMTYTELAMQANMSLAALNRLKSGQTVKVDLRHLEALCEVLHCDPSELIIYVPKEVADFPEDYEYKTGLRKEWIEELKKVRDGMKS